MRSTFFLYAKCDLKDICDNKNNDIPDAQRFLEAPGLYFD